MRITLYDVFKFSKAIKVVELKVGDKGVIKLITQRIDAVVEKIFNLMGIKLPRSVKECKIEKFISKEGIQRDLFHLKC